LSKKNSHFGHNDLTILRFLKKVRLTKRIFSRKYEKGPERSVKKLVYIKTENELMSIKFFGDGLL